jgi:hypothetical protein
MGVNRIHWLLKSIEMDVAFERRKGAVGDPAQEKSAPLIRDPLDRRSASRPSTTVVKAWIRP